MVIKLYNIFSTFTSGEWYSYFCTGKKKNSKQKRLLYDCFQHFVLNYPFLDETQQWGKAYQLLGIPHVCGKIDKEKLKKMYAKEKKDNARITKLKVQLKPGKITMNNQICEKDGKCLNMGQQQSQLLPRQELREPYSNKTVNNRQAIKNNQINHELVSVLDQVYKSEIQSKKRVRFNNVQILCFDKSNSSESEVSTNTLLINEASKQKVNNKNERIIHKPYFERLNDSISSESNTDNEVNNNNLTSASDSLREAESEFNLNKGKPDHEDSKEVLTRETQSNESDIRKLLDILNDENDNRILSSSDQTYNKDSEIYSCSDTRIKIIPPFSSGNEEDDTLSSDSLMNDHDTGIMSPYTSDDELRIISDDKEPTTIREQDEEKVENEVNNDKLNDNQRKSTIILEIRNSASEELSEVTENTRESSTEKIYSTSDEYMTNLEYPITDKINVSEKNVNNDVDDEISKIKHQNSNKEKQKESNDNYSSGDIQEKFVSNTNPCDRKREENEAEDRIQSESGKGNIVISPLSSESSVVDEHFISLIPSGNLMGPTIGNIENFRLNSSASFSQESSVVQEEFGFGNNVTINKSSVLGKDNEKQQILSSDSFNQSNRNEEKNLITGSQCTEGRINSNSNEELLNDTNKKNRIEIGKERLKSKEGFPIIIISDTDTTISSNSENIIQPSLIVDSGNKREPLRSINNVLPKGKNSAGINIIRNRDHRDKENVALDMSDQISPKRNMSREAPPKGSFISDSSSHELDKISGLEEESSHDEDVVQSSCHSKTATDNNGTNKMGKVTESEGSEEKYSSSLDLGSGKNYKKLFQKLKNSTNETPSSDKNKLILSREPSSPDEARETGFVNQVIVLSDSSDILSTSPKDFNNKEIDDKSYENLQEEPNMKENRFIKDISSKNISQNVGKTTQMPTKQVLTFKTAPTTINSSDSWSSKEYLLKNFNKRISKLGKKEKRAISKKSSDIMRKSNYCFKNLSNRDENFAESSSRESIVRKITSVLNDSTLSSPELIISDEEGEQFNINSSFGELLSTQPGKVEVTDLGANAYFNERMKISLESSSNSNIHGTPDDKHHRSSTASQQINNLNLINPETSCRNCESQLMSDAGQLDHKNYSLGSNDDVMVNIDINRRESITNMNVSSIMENELDSGNDPLNTYKRKMTSMTGTTIKCLDMEDHDADSSSDSCIVLSHKKIKRRRKKASRVVMKVKNLPRDHNNKHQTSSDDTEYINEIINEKKKEKLKSTSKKTTTTNSMLINVINEIEEEKITGNVQQKMQQSIAVDKNQSVSNNSNGGMTNVEYDSIGGQHISQEVRKSRKTSIVKQQINSSDTSTTSEYISSALARRIYYL